MISISVNGGTERWSDIMEITGNYLIMYSWYLFNNDSTTRPIDTIKDASFSEYE